MRYVCNSNKSDVISSPEDCNKILRSLKHDCDKSSSQIKPRLKPIEVKHT